MLISCSVVTEGGPRYAVACWDCGKPIGLLTSNELKGLLGQPGSLVCFDCEGQGGKQELPAVEILDGEILHVYEPILQIWLSYEEGAKYGEMRLTPSSILALRLSSSPYQHGSLQQPVRQEGERTNGK